MAFRFSFFDENSIENSSPPTLETHSADLPALRVLPKPTDFYFNLPYHSVVVSHDTLTLKRTAHVPSSFPQGYKPDYDVVSGKYEGGYKIWECSLDLVQYLLTDVTFNNDKHYDVLELGCGQGFPGIAALQKASLGKVCFSDLNAEVLEETTWPNIHLNCSHDMITRAECFAGDWSGLTQSTLLDADPSPSPSPFPSPSPQTPRRQFDLILSAETLYTSDSCRGVLSVILDRLARGGIAVIATKRYYFGLGGGTRELELLVGSYPHLSFSVVKSFEDGQSNIRDILLIADIGAAGAGTTGT